MEFIHSFCLVLQKIKGRPTFDFYSSEDSKPSVNTATRSHADDTEREIKLLKPTVRLEDLITGAVMPEILPPGVMTLERQRYLFRMVRPFVRDPFKGTTCPDFEE